MEEVSNTDMLSSFYIEFEEERKRIESLIPASSESIESISSLRRRLQSILPDLPAHDQASYQEKLKAVENRSQKVSVKKFKFSRKDVPKTGSPNTSAPALALAPPPAPGSQIVQSRLYITQSSGANYQTSLSHLAFSFIDLSDSPETLSAFHASDLSSCVLLLPRISHSVILTNLINCTIILQGGCQQFRLTSSRDTTILMPPPPMGPKDPTIDLCTSLKFGYTSQAAPPTVQDFSHPSTTTASSNYKVLSYDEISTMQRKIATLSAQLRADPASIMSIDLSLG